MTIKLIAVKADQLLEALPNARTVSTLCLHICQWMLEYHMAHLRHDHRDERLWKTNSLLSNGTLI